MFVTIGQRIPLHDILAAVKMPTELMITRIVENIEVGLRSRSGFGLLENVEGIGIVANREGLAETANRLNVFAIPQALNGVAVVALLMQHKDIIMIRVMIGNFLSLELFAAVRINRSVPDRR